MDDALILQKIDQVVRDESDGDVITITPSTSTKDLEDWTACDVRIMVGIERAFKIRLKTADILKVKNVGDLLSTIRAAQG